MQWDVEVYGWYVNICMTAVVYLMLCCFSPLQDESLSCGSWKHIPHIASKVPAHKTSTARCVLHTAPWSLHVSLLPPPAIPPLEPIRQPAPPPQVEPTSALNRLQNPALHRAEEQAHRVGAFLQLLQLQYSVER